MSFMTRTRKRAAISLGIVTVLLVGLLVLTSFMAMFAPMMFDAPGSSESSEAWQAFYGIIGMPVVTLVSIVLSWIVFFFRRHGIALIITLLPLLYIVAIFALL